jgi:hypothetical protein
MQVYQKDYISLVWQKAAGLLRRKKQLPMLSGLTIQNVQYLQRTAITYSS